jgi:hypothetical protein
MERTAGKSEFEMAPRSLPNLDPRLTVVLCGDGLCYDERLL